jgi:hypothetical protein
LTDQAAAYPARGGWQPGETVVPIALLQPHLERIITLIERELHLNENNQHKNRPLDVLAERMSPILGMPAESVHRQIKRVRSGRRRTTSTRFADALFLSMGAYLENTGLPELPGSAAAAAETVRCYFEVHDVEVEDSEIVAWATQLRERTLELVDQAVEEFEWPPVGWDPDLLRFT